jgi:hypothetical protein
MLSIISTRVGMRRRYRPRWEDPTSIRHCQEEVKVLGILRALTDLMVRRTGDMQEDTVTKA